MSLLGTNALNVGTHVTLVSEERPTRPGAGPFKGVRFGRGEGICMLGRSSDKHAAPRCSTFPLNSIALMKVQPRGVNRKGISLTPW